MDAYGRMPVSGSDDRRAVGMAKMQEVYGFCVDPASVPGRDMEMMVDHLFGTLWASAELTCATGAS